MITIFFGICSAILAIIALVQRHRFNEYQKKVFIEQGIFKKPSLSISLFGQNDISKFIIAVPLAEKSIWELPLPIKITNVGDKTSEELEIFYRVNKDLCYGGGAIPFIEQPGAKNAKIVQSDEAGPFISVITALSDIHPGQSFILSARLSISSRTIFPHDVKVTTKDGVDIIVKTWMNYAYVIDCVIWQKDYKPLSKRFTLQVIDIAEETPDKFLDRYNEVLLKNHKEEISKMSFIRKIRLFFQQKNVIGPIALVVIDDSKKTQRSLRVKGDIIKILGISDNDLRIFQGLEWTLGYIFPWPRHSANTKKIGDVANVITDREL